MHPTWPLDRISDTALQVLTLVQGCWLTLDAHEPQKARRAAVLGAVTRLIRQHWAGLIQGPVARAQDCIELQRG